MCFLCLQMFPEHLETCTPAAWLACSRAVHGEGQAAYMRNVQHMRSQKLTFLWADAPSYISGFREGSSSFGLGPWGGMSALRPCCWQQCNGGRRRKDGKNGCGLSSGFLPLWYLHVQRHFLAAFTCELESAIWAAALGCDYWCMSKDVNHRKAVQSPQEIGMLFSTCGVSPTRSLGTYFSNSYLVQVDWAPACTLGPRSMALWGCGAAEGGVCLSDRQATEHVTLHIITPSNVHFVFWKGRCGFEHSAAIKHCSQNTGWGLMDFFTVQLLFPIWTCCSWERMKVLLTSCYLMSFKEDQGDVSFHSCMHVFGTAWAWCCRGIVPAYRR